MILEILNYNQGYHSVTFSSGEIFIFFPSFEIEILMFFGRICFPRQALDTYFPGLACILCKSCLVGTPTPLCENKQESCHPKGCNHRSCPQSGRYQQFLKGNTWVQSYYLGDYSSAVWINAVAFYSSSCLQIIIGKCV